MKKKLEEEYDYWIGELDAACYDMGHAKNDIEKKKAKHKRKKIDKKLNFLFEKLNN